MICQAANWMFYLAHKDSGMNMAGRNSHCLGQMIPRFNPIRYFLQL